MAIGGYAGNCMLYEFRWLIPQPCRLMMRRMLNRAQGKSAAAIRLAPHLHEILNGKVAGGPFAGMNYLPSAAGSELCPKLLGTYEMELWPAIRQALANPYDLVVDAGAAEGYYAVGLAMRIPSARVVSFEINEWARQLQSELAARNGVSSRLEIRGQCTPKELNTALADCRRALLVCDVEGAEMELLDPQAVANVAKADILVELHDGHRAFVSRHIRQRFKDRRIEEFRRRNRQMEDFPVGVQLDEKDKLAAMWENRPLRQNWFWMAANNADL
jgi:hypothetical protein